MRRREKQLAASPRGYLPYQPGLSSTPDMSIIKSELTPSPHLLDHGYGATPQNQLTTGTPAQAPAVKRKLNMDTQHIVVPIKQEFKPPQPKKPKRASPAKKNTRYDTSLGLLTKRFTALLEKSPNGVVDLNKASQDMDVPKRRIYDITNVLEGIGILEKKSKNNIQWSGGSTSGYKLTSLRTEVQALEDQENTLDEMIDMASKVINSKHGYITYHDLRSIPENKNKTVMAIKAPPNTNLQLPERRDGEGHSIFLKSDSKEIDVFLCPEHASPPRKTIPEMDMLLKDFPISPENVNLSLRTPPVPQFESPLPEPKPIYSQTCRKITFVRNLQDPGMEEPSRMMTTAPSVSENKDDTESLLKFVNLIGQQSPVGNWDSDSYTTSSSLLHDSFYGFDKSTFKSEDLGNTDILFNETSLISLEPLLNTEYSYSLDNAEGLADLYQF